MLPRFKIQYPMKNQYKNRVWLAFSVISYPRPLIALALLNQEPWQMGQLPAAVPGRRV